jgi:hypothetical protein
MRFSFAVRLSVYNRECPALIPAGIRTILEIDFHDFTQQFQKKYNTWPQLRQLLPSTLHPFHYFLRVAGRK